MWEKEGIIMTQRDFYNAVIKANVNAELTEYATTQIEKLDARNEKRKTTETPKQKENNEIKDKIIAILTEATEPKLASEIAEAVGISLQKASSLCRKLVDEDKAVAGEKKVKGKGNLKTYALA